MSYICYITLLCPSRSDFEYIIVSKVNSFCLLLFVLCDSSLTDVKIEVALFSYCVKSQISFSFTTLTVQLVFIFKKEVLGVNNCFCFFRSLTPTKIQSQSLWSASTWTSTLTVLRRNSGSVSRWVTSTLISPTLIFGLFFPNYEKPLVLVYRASPWKYRAFWRSPYWGSDSRTFT